LVAACYGLLGFWCEAGKADFLGLLFLFRRPFYCWDFHFRGNDLGFDGFKISKTKQTKNKTTVIP
jgi:hypothetical protein